MLAPLHQQAIAWIRNVHRIEITPKLQSFNSDKSEKNYQCEINIPGVHKYYVRKNDESMCFYKSFEEALEVGLFEVLKILK